MKDIRIVMELGTMIMLMLVVASCIFIACAGGIATLTMLPSSDEPSAFVTSAPLDLAGYKKPIFINEPALPLTYLETNSVPTRDSQ